MTKDPYAKTVVFLSGPYRSSTENGIYRNIQTAREYAVKLWKQDYAVVCPHLNSAFMGGIVPDSVFLTGDLEILKRCDAFCRLPYWADSEGAREEIAWAEANGLKEVFVEE